MNRGIYPILSGAIAQEQRLQVVSNNVANAQTNGFKRDEPLFSSILSQSKGRPSMGPSAAHSLFSSPFGTTNKSLPHAFVYIQEHKTELAPGRLRETKNNLHAAIQGDGFFEIKTALGTRYTKNGNFHIDAGRRLVTAMGDPVLGPKGEIKVPPGEAKLMADGTVTVDGTPAGIINIVEFPQNEPAKKSVDGMFVGENPAKAKTPSLAVGHVEESNVNSLEEMVKVISAMRNFESAQKAIATFDQLAQSAIQDVGRVL